MTDEEWKMGVATLACKTFDRVSYKKAIEALNAHLWKTPEQFLRLALEAPKHTGFLSELAAPAPDYTLRRRYRDALIAETAYQK